MTIFHQLSLILLLSALVLHPYTEATLTEGYSTSKHMSRRDAPHRAVYQAKSQNAKPQSPSRPVKPNQKTPAPTFKNVAMKTRQTAAPSVACKPFTEHFTTTVGTGGSQWVSLSSRRDSFRMTPGGGLELVLNPPAGAVTVSKDGHTNDKLGDGASINSTFSLFYGKVSYTLQASGVPGTVSAAVLIGTKTDDEIDVEILGGDPTHWQTNVFRSAPGETSPLYGVFGGVHGYPGNGRCDAFHTYLIDWSPSRIQWSVDGQVVRTLTPAQTLHNGQQHYPSAPSRLQIGVWDASNPSGTSQWAKGPIPWSKIGNSTISAKIKSVVVECPYN